MSEIRFITSTDEHVADLSPGFRKDDYRSSILSKLEWQGDFAKKYNANAILRGGDMFHVKAANKTTHATVQKVAQIHKDYSCPTYSLAGNHDMSNNDPDSILRQQPLGVLFRTGVINRLKDEVFTSGSLKARIIGIDYTTDMDVQYLCDEVKKKDDDQIVIAVVHALASFAPSEKIQSFFNENIFDYRDLVFPGCPDVYVFGHYHKDQSIVDHLGVKFINVGSVSRGALTFENLERKPKISAIKISSSGVDVEEIIIPHQDAADIFDLNLKKKIDSERKDLNDFITRLKSDHNTTYDSRKEELDSFPDDLKKLALEIMEAAEAGVLED